MALHFCRQNKTPIQSTLVSLNVYEPQGSHESTMTGTWLKFEGIIVCWGSKKAFEAHRGTLLECKHLRLYLLGSEVVGQWKNGEGVGAVDPGLVFWWILLCIIICRWTSLGRLMNCALADGRYNCSWFKELQRVEIRLLHVLFDERVGFPVDRGNDKAVKSPHKSMLRKHRMTAKPYYVSVRLSTRKQSLSEINTSF